MAASRAPKQSGTAERILDVAERLVQVRGFNGFSYADIASELGITTASMHYHYASKAELGHALIARYAGRFTEALSDIDEASPDARTKLEAYTALYSDVLRGERMCLCGILAAEFQTLPEPMRDAVLDFFDENERWLTAVLIEGRKEKTLRFSAPPEEVARGILGALEGAMLVARPYGDVARFDSTARQLLGGLAS